MEINAIQLAANVLNALISAHDLPLDVQDGLYIALALIDPQPEDDFFETLREAYKVTGADLNALEAMLDEAEGALE